MTENPQTCQKCGSPVTPGMKFCESCGAKIGAGPACPECGAPLPPGVKFCESCGKPIAAAPAAPAETPAAVPVTPPAAPSPEPPRAAETETPKTPDRPKAEEKPAPEERPAASPAKAGSPVKQPAAGPPEQAGTKKPVSQTTMIIAGVIVLALLGAGIFFVGIPMMSGPGGTPQGQSGQTAVPAATGPSGSGQAAAGAGLAELTAGPTQTLPTNRDLIIDVERDAITSLITVKFQGGEGQYAVRELAVTLTKSDGTVERKSFRPEYRGTFLTLQGTEKTDRVEITANFYNGESYKVVDKILEFKRRNW